MATGATKWAWENSRASNGSLIVLLAIADECGKERTAEMTTAELARKSRLSERGVQNAVRELAALGELSVRLGPGRGNRNRYSPCPLNPADSSSNPAESAPFEETPQNLHPAESAPFKHHPRRSDPNPAESTGVEISNMLLTVTGSPLVPVKDVPAKPPRDDAERLCEHLASKIEANGSRRPVVNAKWRDAARLLIDKDGRTEEQVRAAIDWCQQDEFWRANILSMPKLREKYDQLRMQAMRGKSPSAQANSNLDVVARYMQRVGNGNTE
jgi:hypothetical protein